MMLQINTIMCVELASPRPSIEQGTHRMALEGKQEGKAVGIIRYGCTHMSRSTHARVRLWSTAQLQCTNCNAHLFLTGCTHMYLFLTFPFLFYKFYLTTPSGSCYRASSSFKAISLRTPTRHTITVYRGATGPPDHHRVASCAWLLRGHYGGQGRGQCGGRHRHRGRRSKLCCRGHARCARLWCRPQEGGCTVASVLAVSLYRSGLLCHVRVWRGLAHARLHAGSGIVASSREPSVAGPRHAMGTHTQLDPRVWVCTSCYTHPSSPDCMPAAHTHC